MPVAATAVSYPDLSESFSPSPLTRNTITSQEAQVRQLLQDLRYGLRVLAKSPGLTLVIILSLAIGIGANTAVFSVADALLLKPLPYPQPDRLAILWLRSPGIGIPEDWPSPGQYLDIQQGNHSFEQMAICIGTGAVLSGREQPERVEVMRAS